MIATELSYEPGIITTDTLPLYPEAYRKDLVRLMSMQAYAERLGATELSLWVKAAPNYRDRLVLAKIANDEARHSYLLYLELEKIGVTEAEALRIAEEGTMGAASEHAMAGPRAVGDADNQWVDIILNSMLLDRVGQFMLANFTNSSYRPWAEACEKMMPDERMHVGFGVKCFRRYLRGGWYQDHYSEEEMARKASHWYSMGLNFFGPPSGRTAERQKSFGLKRKSNEELRQEYRREVEALFEELSASHLLRVDMSAYPYRPLP